jgi:hypothetical protein
MPTPLKCGTIDGVAANAQPDIHPPERYPEPWLFDTEHLLRELDRVRELILQIPLHPDTFAPTNTAVAAIWELRDRLRYLLQLRTEGQWSWQKKAQAEGKATRKTLPRTEEKKARKVAFIAGG